MWGPLEEVHRRFSFSGLARQGCYLRWLAERSGPLHREADQPPAHFPLPLLQVQLTTTPVAPEGCAATPDLGPEPPVRRHKQETGVSGPSLVFLVCVPRSPAY